jgi:hypothetical protein
MQTVSIYRDNGKEAELHGGLEGGETLVLNLPPYLANGSKVTPAGAPEKPGEQTAGRSG